MILQQGMGTPSNASTRSTEVSDVPVPIANALVSAMGAHSDATTRTAAAEQMRYQLYLLDRSQRRPSIEDVASELLECESGEAQA